jgi:hypothetical protein
VDFVWHGEKAMHPKWRTLRPPMLGVVKNQMEAI